MTAGGGQVRPLRILYVAAGTPVPGAHGGSVHVAELCAALAARGHEVHLAALPGTFGGRGPERVRQHDLPRPWLPQLEWMGAGHVRAVTQKLEPDVIIERFYTFGGTGLLAAKAFRLPGVLEVNSPARSYPGSLRDWLDRLSLLRPVHRWRERQLSLASACYTTSVVLLPERLQDEVRVVVNGVNLERFRPAGRGTEGAPAEGGPLQCVYVSSFRSWHAAKNLIAAVGYCLERSVDLHVECIGEGPQYNAAQAAASAAGLQNHVKFLGRIPHAEVPARLAAAQVGLAPFDPSGFLALELGWFWSPIKIFEYLGSGLAVVTADIPELRDLLPGNVAEFYAAGRPKALADVLTRLAADPGAVVRMGNEARKLANRYSWDHQAAIVEELLASVVGG